MEAKDYSNNAFQDLRSADQFHIDPRNMMNDSHSMTGHNHMDPYNQRYYPMSQGTMNPMSQGRMPQQNYIVPSMPLTSAPLLQLYPRVPLPSQMMEEEPIYVNAKQYQRIIKRRQARSKYATEHDKSDKRKEPYMHKSRHEHAKRRARGPGGRFLSKKEIKEKEKNGELAFDTSLDTDEKDDKKQMSGTDDMSNTNSVSENSETGLSNAINSPNNGTNTSQNNNTFQFFNTQNVVNKPDQSAEIDV
ncbi:hypothetical protein WA158_003954 [Blastocystis sp. Blastoise]